ARQGEAGAHSDAVERASVSVSRDRSADYIHDSRGSFRGRARSGRWDEAALRGESPRRHDREPGEPGPQTRAAESSQDETSLRGTRLCPGLRRRVNLELADLERP